MTSKNLWRLLLQLGCGVAFFSSELTAAAPPLFPASGGALTPRLSPDGKWIAASYQGLIGKLPAKGGALIALTRGEGWDSDPAWSPDGKHIGYTNSTLSHFQIIDAETGRSVLSGKPVCGNGPYWFDPTGRRVLGCFSPTRIPFPPLSWLDVDTGQLTAPLRFGGLDERLGRGIGRIYTLSEDGRSIIFAVHPDLPNEQLGNNGPQAEVFRAPADGGTPERLFRFEARIYGLCPSGDGKGLYLVTDAGSAHNDVWYVPFDAAERGARKITFGQADEDSVSVDQDGRLLVYTENSSGTTVLVREDLVTGETESVPLSKVDYGQPTASVRLVVTDKRSGEPEVSRISIKKEGDKFFAPPGALYRVTSGLAHFYARAEAQLELPVGKYTLRAFRGPEYRVCERQFEVSAGSSDVVRIELERWTDAAARGWYSGENHIHANYGYGLKGNYTYGKWYNTPQVVFDMCDGEDLHVGNIMVANCAGDGVFDREFFTGKPHPLSSPRCIIYWGEEFRSALWGHMTLFNLHELVEPIFTGFKGTTNPWDIPTNADIVARASAQGGMTSYTHPGSADLTQSDDFLTAYSGKGVPVDVALGNIDAMDVMCRTYASSLRVWYHVLNCGFRMPAAAGTDCTLSRLDSLPPGWGRVYVRLADGLSYEGWIAALKAGRTFVSNGPMVEFSLNDKPIGDTIKLRRPGVVRVRGRADAQFPIQHLELIQNGEVVATGKIAANRKSAILDEEVTVERSSWLALRTSGPAVEYWTGDSQRAHTSPIYVEVQDHPMDSKADAEYFLIWLDRLDKMLNERDRMHTGRAHVESHLAYARAVYRDLLQGGNKSNQQPK